MQPERPVLWCGLLSLRTEVKNFVLMTREEVLMVLNWRNHPEIANFMFRNTPISEEEHFSFIEKLKETNTRFYYLVFKEEKPIGVIYITNICWAKRQGELGLYRNPELRGVGTILLESLENLASILGLSRLLARVLPDNHRALSLYGREGYRPLNKSPEFLLLGKRLGIGICHGQL